METAPPLLSIITATYNSAATLADTLRSVRGQSLASVEHIVVDGCSTDGSAELARGFGVDRLLVEPDRGLYDAFNKGIALARGRYVGILNSDDFYAHPRVLERVVEALEASGADCLYGDLLYVDAQDTAKVLRYWKSGPYDSRRFRRGWMPPHPTFFCRRELYERWGGFRLDLRTANDYELMLRFLHKHMATATYLPQVLVRMRVGGQSNANWRARLNANREDRAAWRLNGLPVPHLALFWKPLRKLGQFRIPKLLDQMLEQERGPGG